MRVFAVCVVCVFGGWCVLDVRWCVCMNWWCVCVACMCVVGVRAVVVVLLLLFVDGM